MAPSLLDEQTASCNSQHNWLMSMAMDSATLCDSYIFRGKNGTSEFHLAVFSVDVAFAHHFVAPSSPIEVLVIAIGHTSKNYLKWWVIQLAIH